MPSEASSSGGGGIPGKGGKRRLRLMIAVVVVVAIVVVAVIGYYILKGEHFSFTTCEQTSVVRDHLPSGVETATTRFTWSLSSSDFEIGKPMTFWINAYNPSGGSMIMTSVIANVTGFAFQKASPPLPLIAPSTADPSAGQRVDLTFTTPSTDYDGLFRYTVYWDWYPNGQPTGHNNITEVTETQVIYTHGTPGVTVQKGVVTYPTLAGEYQAGADMHLTILYHHIGNYRENLTAVTANTSGFAFAGSLPALPTALPNGSGAPLSITFDFSSPSVRYTGAFSFTTYFDIYPSVPGQQYHTLTSVLETQYVTAHLGPQTSTAVYHHWHNLTAGLYPVGVAMSITEPYWNVQSGSMSITSIASNTTGFAFAGTSPQLPVAVPNSPDGSTNVTVIITFSVPSTPYAGPFEYIVNFDSYLTL